MSSTFAIAVLTDDDVLHIMTSCNSFQGEDYRDRNLQFKYFDTIENVKDFALLNSNGGMLIGNRN